MTRSLGLLFLGCLLPASVGCAEGRASPRGPSATADPATFARDVAPVIGRFCVRCHGGAKPRGGLALDRILDRSSARENVSAWEKVAESLRSGAMPPLGKPRPSEAQLDRVNAWLDSEVLKVDCTGPRDPGRVTLRRLNRAEYNNTVHDLVGVILRPADDFPSDDVGYGFDNIGDVLSMPPILMEKYLNAAEKVVDQAFASAAARKRLLVKPLDDQDKPAAARAILRTFADRAYRRPVREDELRRLVRLVESAQKAGDNFDGAVRLALQAVLVSPNFLFHVELDPLSRSGEPAAPHPVDDWELASRLSYFLWSSMPDEELFRLARGKNLRKPAVLEAQVRRMLVDPKARALTDNFAAQWLQTRNLKSFTPDPGRFPTFDDALRSAMQQETEMYFAGIVREDHSVLEFLDSDYSYLNERLACHYGVAGVKGSVFRRVKFSDRRRGGVLTQASVLAVTSNPTRTSPVKRGKWILDNILGTPPPPPPPGVEELKDDRGAVLTGTLRQRMEQHRADSGCASCHQRMDPLGFGFENFDAVGTWRDKEAGQPVDASGTLPGGVSFNGPAELRTVLLTKKDAFVRCLVDKLLTYALGRGTERCDRCALDTVARDAARHDYRFGSLVLAVVRSEPFQMRKPQGAKK